MTEQVEFEKFKLVVLTELTDDLIHDFALAPKVNLSINWLDDSVTLRIIQETYGETLGELDIKRPATWFQALKKQHAPYWLRRRWPVRYITESYDARALYPKLKLPDELHNYVWVKAR